MGPVRVQVINKCSVIYSLIHLFSLYNRQSEVDSPDEDRENAHTLGPRNMLTSTSPSQCLVHIWSFIHVYWDKIRLEMMRKEEKL